MRTALQQRMRTHVRYGSKADIAASPTNVRFTPKSGHRCAQVVTQFAKLASASPDRVSTIRLSDTGRAQRSRWRARLSRQSMLCAIGSGPNPRAPGIECGCRRKFLPPSRFMGPKPQNPKNKRLARRLFAKNSTNNILPSVLSPMLLRIPIPPNHGPAPVAPGRRNINRCCGPANVVQAAMKSTTSRCSRHPGSDPMRASHLFTEGCVAARS